MHGERARRAARCTCFNIAKILRHFHSTNMQNNNGVGVGVGVGVRKGAWAKQEDILLKKCIEKHGEGKWHLVPLRAGLNRCRKSCRLRWLNYLRPNIKRGYFTRDEVDLVVRLHKLLGNRWSLIAGRLPGRTANDVKNLWNTRIEKNKISSAAGREAESCSRAKTITESSILRPRPRTFSKLQVPGCPSTHDQLIAKTNNHEIPKEKQQPSLSQGQLDPNGWTTNLISSDECLGWWSKLLEISTENEERSPLLFSSEDHQISKEPILSPRLCDSKNFGDEDGLSSLPLDVNVWDFVSFQDQ